VKAAPCWSRVCNTWASMAGGPTVIPALLLSATADRHKDGWELELQHSEPFLSGENCQWEEQ
jgi:hypothetical protein